MVGAIIGGLGQIASQAIGTIKAANQRRALDKARDNLKAWRDQEVNQDFLDRADSRDLLRQLRETYQERQRRMETGNIKGGATAESRVAQATAENKGIAAATSRIAAAGQQYKDNVRKEYRDDMKEIDQRAAEMSSSGAQALTDSLSSAFGTLGSLVSDIRGSKTDKNAEAGANA